MENFMQQSTNFLPSQNMLYGDPSGPAVERTSMGNMEAPTRSSDLPSLEERRKKVERQVYQEYLDSLPGSMKSQQIPPEGAIANRDVEWLLEREGGPSPGSDAKTSVESSTGTSTAQTIEDSTIATGEKPIRKDYLRLSKNRSRIGVIDPTVVNSEKDIAEFRKLLLESRDLFFK